MKAVRTYDVSFRTPGAAFQLQVYENHKESLFKQFSNQYEVIDWLFENERLTEADGDFYYDPIKNLFRFRDELSEMQYLIGD